MNWFEDLKADNSRVLDLTYTLLQSIEEYCKNEDVPKKVRSIFEDFKTMINLKLHKSNAN